MNPCVIGVDISLTGPVSGDSAPGSGQYETAGLSLRPLQTTLMESFVFAH